jgi:hypothetical protein
MFLGLNVNDYTYSIDSQTDMFKKIIAKTTE